MGLFTSLCKNCDNGIDWFLEAKKGIKCEKCGTHNTEQELKESMTWCNSEYRKDKESFLRKRKSIRERKLKLDKIKNSM